MISFNEALDCLMENAAPLGTESIPLETSLGRVLAEDIHSDIDMPPFHKSAVDGFACRLADLAVESGHTVKPGHAPSLEVMETIPAGAIPSMPIGPGQCSRIMTGAMIPEGADAIIMVEDTEEMPDGKIRFMKDTTAPNICFKGEDILTGDQVLTKGSLISAPEVAVLASVGAVNPVVFKQPSVSVISTGDELVNPSILPGPGMIRNSNSAQLIAQLGQLNLNAADLGISGDSKEALRNKINKGLKTADVLILSGGVSMGDYDYVPVIMKELGIEILFKSIAIQPGRPTVFGRKGSSFVFGLPGNPVSSFVIFELLVKQFLYKLMGHTFSPTLVRLPLGKSMTRRNPARKSFLPVFIREEKVYPVDYHGSAHIHAYIHAQGMVSIETGITELNQGDLHDVRLL